MSQREATTGKRESGRANLSDRALDECGQWFSAQGRWWLELLGREDALGVAAERVVVPETQAKRKLTPSPASSWSAGSRLRCISGHCGWCYRQPVDKN